MGFFRRAKKFGRRVVKQQIKATKRGKRWLGKAAGTAKTVLGRVDKLTGGAATKALSAHPYGQAALAGINTADALLN